MAWLNLNTEFGYGWNEYMDWEEMPFEDEMTNYEHEFYRNYGYCPSSIFRPLPCDDYPFRSHMKNKYDYWGYKDWEKAKDVGLWKFIHYVIENNIDKPFPQAFKYFCKFAKPYLQKYFLEQFNNYKRWRNNDGSYWIDEDNIIRAHDYRHRKYLYRRQGKIETVFMSHDYEEVWELELTESSWMSGRKDQVHTIVRSVPKGDMNMWSIRAEFNYRSQLKPLKLLNTKGIKEIFDNKQSPRYKKLRAEDNQKIRKKEREKQRSIKNKVYSLKPSFLNETSTRAI